MFQMLIIPSCAFASNDVPYSTAYDCRETLAVSLYLKTSKGETYAISNSYDRT